MTRRILLYLLPSALFAQLPTWEKGNSFAKAYHDWAALRNTRVGSEATVSNLDVREVAAWRKVQALWRELESSVAAEYRG